jgi:hypothetical protein
MAIRAAHEASGQHEQRRKVLVPTSAHGTNPATAAFVGYTVVEVAQTDDGRVDVADLASKLGDDVAALTLALDTRRRAVELLGEDHPVSLTALDRQARFEHRLGRHDEALTHGAEALQRRRAALGPDHRDTLRSATNLLRYRLGRGDQPSPHDAERLLDHWHRIDPDRLEPAHLAAMHLELRLRRRILAHDAAALAERYRSTLGPDHPDTLRAAQGLAELATDTSGT